MSTKLKLLAASSALGWVLVVPVLLTALLDPFLGFRAWPDDALGGRAQATAQLAEAPRAPGTGAAPATGDGVPAGTTAPEPPRLVASLPGSSGQAPARRRGEDGTVLPRQRRGGGRRGPAPGGTGPTDDQGAGTPVTPPAGSSAPAPAEPTPAAPAPAPEPPAATPSPEPAEPPRRAHRRPRGRDGGGRTASGSPPGRAAPPSPAGPPAGTTRPAGARPPGQSKPDQPGGRAQDPGGRGSDKDAGQPGHQGDQGRGGPKGGR